MNGKTVFLIIFGMFVSFSLISGLLISLIDPTLSPKKPKVKRGTQSVKTIPTRLPAPRRAQTNSTISQPPPPAPTRLTTSSAPIPKAGQPSTIDPAPKANQEMNQLKKSLGKQLNELKQERASKLNALARELTLMDPSNAAAQLAHLDDEAAALTLAKIPIKKRTKILAATEKKLATRLKKRLKTIR